MSKVAYFRKKPVVIEAIQWTGNMSDVIGLIGHDLPTFGEDKSGSLRIATLEGDHEVSPNDWIIRGVKGEFYPCNEKKNTIEPEPQA
jgi:hypothetical protein